MKRIENTRGADRRAVMAAVQELRQGNIIVYPTDTIYALGCDALNNRAIERICRIKGINPDKNSLAIICRDLAQAAEYARIDNTAFRYLRHHLPGPFTFILPASTTLPKVFKGRRTVGIRIPDNDFALALAEELGNPVMTSTVPAGDDESLTDPEELQQRLGAFADISLFVDAGEGSDVPGTVIDCTDSHNPEIIRQGAGIFEG